MIIFFVLAALITAIFAVLGTMKILALPPARVLAVRSGFSVMAYRRIGALQLAGATGVVAGATVPPLGLLAGSGLLLLLVGALIIHVRHRDSLGAATPAVVCAFLVSGYLVALLATSS